MRAQRGIEAGSGRVGPVALVAGLVWGVLSVLSVRGRRDGVSQRRLRCLGQTIDSRLMICVLIGLFKEDLFPIFV